MRIGVLIALAVGGPASALAADQAVEATVAAAVADASTPDAPLKLRSLVIEGRRAAVGIELASWLPLAPLPTAVDNAFEHAVGAIEAAHPEVDTIDLLVAHPGKPLTPPPRSAREPRGPTKPQAHVFVDPGRYPHGQALRGRTIAISPGHGYIYYDSLGRYSTQRSRIRWNDCGDCRGIVEDFETHEIAVQHLVPLLEGAGAKVILMRERSYASTGSIVDDGDPGYSETTGFTDGNNPGGHDGDYRVSRGGAATWTLTAPSVGEQLASLWFVHGSNRSGTTSLSLTSEGTTRTFVLDQRTHGLRWVPLSVLDLEAGQQVQVELQGAMGTVAVADAVRLGAGQHSSGHPWWQMGAKPYAAYQSAPSAVQARGDVTTRPRYAEHFGADLYLSLHSNAAGSGNTARGTVTYRFNCRQYSDHSNDPDPSLCDDPVGSDRLQEIVHRRLVEAITQEWDPNWRDRGTKVANFGELRELDGIPGVLIESAFHDNTVRPQGVNLRTTDNQALHDPRWRRTAGYAIYRGLSEFLVGDGPLLAHPPTALYARQVGPTSVEISFDAAAEALGYRVYVASGNRVFDDGRIITESPAVIEGLVADAPVFLRVASLNAAGEGLPSPVVASRPSRRRAQLLIVDAYQREDAWVQELDNRHDTAMVHGQALASTDVAFDTVDEARLSAGVDLSIYDGLVIALGRESTEHQVLTPQIRDQVAAFVAAGGVVFASGSEVAWALDRRGDDASRAFLDGVFGAAYGRDDAGEATVRGASGGWLAAVGPLTLDDGSAGGVPARFSDVFTAGTDGQPQLTYGAGTDVAAISRGDNLVVGFALDSVVGMADRAALVSAWVDRAVVIDTPAPVDAGVVIDAGAPTPDAGEIADAEAPDAVPAPDARPAPDAGFPDAEVAPDAEVVLRPASGERPVSGGCGCAVETTRRGRPGSATFALLLLGGALMFRRRS